jgi:hypothetical protein
VKRLGHQAVLMWVVAFAITAAAAYYQRVTGPTYPVTGRFVSGGKEVFYRFDRSHSGDGDHPVRIPMNHPGVSGVLEWKRHNTDDEWTRVEMKDERGMLVASLPHQPAAGKLDYRVTLQKGNERIEVPSGDPVIIRFKGDVPLAVLIPHVLIIFGAVLLSTRTGLEYFSASPDLKRLTLWTLGLLFVGGMILGPIVQYYAFGAFWTGFPFGTDLTDNKVLVALLAWIGAGIGLYKSKKPAVWVLAAAIVLLVVFSIPHSVLGSELDYSEQGMR